MTNFFEEGEIIYSLNKIPNEEKYEYKIQINNEKENFLIIDKYFGELKEDYPIE